MFSHYKYEAVGKIHCVNAKISSTHRKKKNDSVNPANIANCNHMTIFLYLVTPFRLSAYDPLCGCPALCTVRSQDNDSIYLFNYNTDPGGYTHKLPLPDSIWRWCGLSYSVLYDMRHPTWPHRRKRQAKMKQNITESINVVIRTYITIRCLSRRRQMGKGQLRCLSERLGEQISFRLSAGAE